MITNHRSLTEDDDGTINQLRVRERGVAVELTRDQLAFAAALQEAHDNSAQDGPYMEMRFRKFGEERGLEWPAEGTVVQ